MSIGVPPILVPIKSLTSLFGFTIYRDGGAMSEIYRAASQKKRELLLKNLARLSYPQKYEAPYSDIPFGEITTVWADFALSKLRSEAKIEMRLLSPRAEEKLTSALSLQLSDRCAPTLAALLRLSQLEKKLEGDTPKERYLFFVEKILSKKEYLEGLFQQFAPLASFIASHILLWIDQVKEFVGRFYRDLSEIQDYFSLEGKRIEDLSTSLSDLHHGNRSVYQLIFDNGVSLIYKPKGLGLDKAYNKFVHELNHLGLKPKLKTYKIMDKGTYGWVEFVETLPCDTEGEVHRYFERFGMLIALMFILEGTDCHFENVICSGEHPVLIDLESLFHPTLKSFKDEPELTVWNRSVFRTGFLPSFGVSAQRWADISPLSADEIQETPQESARWQDVNTDQMQFVFEKRKVKMSIPRPKFNGQIVSSRNYVDDLLVGFEKMYRLFSSKKKVIASLLDPLFNYPVRCVFRATSLYFRILQRFTDPLQMHSQTEVDRTLEVLMRFSPVNGYGDLPSIVEREKEALLYGDIPFFLSSANDCHMYYGSEIVAKNCFKTAARKIVLDKIKDLNDQDLKIQLEYIKNSLRFLDCTHRQTDRYKPSLNKGEIKRVSDKGMVELAKQIGEKVLSLSQPLSDGTFSWVTLELDPAINRYIFQPISSTLYSGSAGIALFFAALGKISKNEIFLQQAENLLGRIKKSFIDNPEASLLVTGVGGMSGLGGLIYTFTAVGSILREKEYLGAASHLASLIDQKKIEEDTNYDVVLGSAGLILALLSLYEKTKEKFLLEKAKIAGQFLLQKAILVDGAIAWPCSGETPLCGFSHGVAGISYALFKLAKMSKEAKFKKVAEQALLYERKHYSPKKQNWLDLRPGKERSNPFSWCHGAPGIGLARLYSSKLYPDAKMTKEIHIALKTTEKHLLGGIDHLCCGNFGRLAILWDAGIVLKNKKLQEIVLKETALQLKKFAKTGKFTLYLGLSDQMESPSLMQGLSGIGYFLLRLTEKGKSLPEVLILE